jgi:hypothetical protein
LFSIESGSKAIPTIVKNNDKANEIIIVAVEILVKNPDVQLVIIAI